MQQGDNRGGAKKHPLENRWVLWFDDPEMKKRGREQDWGASLKMVYGFDTVEDFWCLFNNVVQPSQLPIWADMHLFRDGIAPKWEDVAFKKGDEQHGGKWTCIIKERKIMDEYWLNTCLALIGEQFNEPAEIAGVVVSVRKQVAKICLWTRTEQNQAVQTQIAIQFKKVLDMNESEKITYQTFKDELDNERKDLYIV